MKKQYSYIDAHAHLNFDAFAEDRGEVIAKMKTEKIGAINVGIDLVTSQESITLAKEHENIWASVGCHPTEAGADFSAEPYAEIIKSSRHNCTTLGVAQNVVAIGECGLDYFRKAHRTDREKALQQQAFEAQIELALRLDLPLILHLRPRVGTMDAYEDGLDILENYAKKQGDKLRGTAHFFVGDAAIAKRFLDLGFYLSATGPVSFDQDLQQVFAELPTDRLLVETDAPFAAPVAYRGQRNSPLYIPDIAAALAALTGTPEPELAEKLHLNTERLFSL
jgi:TatD DNase family protein